MSLSKHVHIKITVKKVRSSTVWCNREWIIVGALCCVIKRTHHHHCMSLVSSLPVDVHVYLWLCVCEVKTTAETVNIIIDFFFLPDLDSFKFNYNKHTSLYFREFNNTWVIIPVYHQYSLLVIGKFFAHHLCLQVSVLFMMRTKEQHRLVFLRLYNVLAEF